MGYCASGGGAIFLQKNCPEGYEQIAQALKVAPEKVLEAILDKITEVFEMYDSSFESQNDCYIAYVCHPYDKYHDDDINELFDLLSPVLAVGTWVDFTGEDDCLWCFRTREGVSCEEVNGFVEYTGPLCNQDDCAYCHKRECRYHAVYGEFPVYGENENRCSGYVKKGER